MSPGHDLCRFRILGPVQIVGDGGPLRFARRQHLDLAAFLLLHAEQVVTTAQIVDAMWGEAVPRTASAQIKNMLSALRGALHGGDQPLATVERQPAGYRLHIVSGQLDLALFHQRVAESRITQAPAEARQLLRSAIELWQGTVPLAGVRAAFADAARTHLREQRDSALEELFDAELAGGEHTTIVPALTVAVSENPGRERLVGQLMLALYRSGRVTDALGAYQRARRVLAEDFGLEPGRELQELERRILRDDPALGLPTRAAVGRPASVPVPAQLPLDVRGFAGREAELATLHALVTDRASQPAPVVVALMGMAGVGKTALAVHWAHQVAERFPDGQLYVDLRGFHPGAEAISAAAAIRGFLDAFSVAPERIPPGTDAQVALYRSLLPGRRVLVVLDNALDAEQVRPLLPGATGCLVIVTSRNLLTGLVAGEGAVPMTLDALTEPEARELLRRRVGAERVAAETRAAELIARQCGRLPLALALVAARAAIHPRFPLATLSAELSTARDGVGALGGASGDEVRAAFSWSYRRLAPEAATLFRLLGLHRGPLVAPAGAASLLGRPLDEARLVLADLARAHLVVEQVPGRFALHDLLRAYAAELAHTVEPAADQRAATRRLLDHYLHTAYRAALLIYPHRYHLELPPAMPGAQPVELEDAEAAAGWFAAERAGLIAAVGLAADLGLGGHAWRLASATATYLTRRGHWQEWAAIQQVALAAAERASDRAGQAHAHGSLGLAYDRLKRYGEASVHLQWAHELYGELDDHLGHAYTHMRMCGLDDNQGDHAAALRHAERALELFRTAGHRTGIAQALNLVGWSCAQLGQYPKAIDHCRQAVLLHRSLDDHQGVAHALDSLGYAHHLLGEHGEAVPHLEEALGMLRRAGDQYYESITLTHLSDSLRAAGDVAAARDALRRAHDILDKLGHPDAKPAYDRLTRLDGE